LEDAHLFENILVPTDLQEKSQAALNIAVRMALRDPGRIWMLHVIETIDDTAEGEFDAFYEKLRARALKKMDDMIAFHADKPVHIEGEIAYGKRVQKIVDFAREKDVDLIILPSHRIDWANPAEGWATISYRVAILAPCHVMMVK
jgi:nucleotide-binding universal stress UspA family protein